MALSQKGFGPQPPVLKVRQPDYAVSRQTEPAVDALNRVAQQPLLGSTLLEVSLSVPATLALSTILRVKHGLGRAYRGWFLVGNENDGLMVFEVTPNPDKAEVLLLRGRVDAAVVSPSATTKQITLAVF